MTSEKKEPKYPENLYLKEKVEASGYKITALAKRIGVSRLVLSNTINGHYKGTNIVPELLKALN